MQFYMVWVLVKKIFFIVVLFVIQFRVGFEVLWVALYVY